MNADVVASIDWVLKIVSPAAIALAAVVFYVSVRSGSWHMFRLRLWRMIHSEKSVPEACVQSVIDELTSWVAFRYITGINVRSMSVATRLIEWMRENKEDAVTIAVAGSYFDCEQLQLKEHLPQRGARRGLVLGIAVVTLTFYAVAVIGFSPRAYFYFKDSGRWFTATTTDIESVGVPLIHTTVRIDADRCQSKTVLTGHFSEVEVGQLCEYVVNPEMMDRVNKTVSEQRVSSVLFMTILGGLFYYFLLLLRQAICVRDLALRLQKKSTSSPQLGGRAHECVDTPQSGNDQLSKANAVGTDNQPIPASA